ncbi:hypothetical protein CANCADRAFT_46222 [Tortispora caseinolytica NRRL Y-17796]|uniref:Uncharacterized protein n=1 Tax=Tortispora caseinolytica NRRL Y-17796 TaxID=767744 RepID=A0A1E4TDH9_9ASCO|nr:hypothetical protein CANCADRAFT_46222 [Tortispora caseinolytica NRRL Y-17796]
MLIISPAQLHHEMLDDASDQKLEQLNKLKQLDEFHKFDHPKKPLHSPIENLDQTMFCAAGRSGHIMNLLMHLFSADEHAQNLITSDQLHDLPVSPSYSDLISMDCAPTVVSQPCTDDAEFTMFPHLPAELRDIVYSQCPTKSLVSLSQSSLLVRKEVQSTMLRRLNTFLSKNEDAFMFKMYMPELKPIAPWFETTYKTTVRMSLPRSPTSSLSSSPTVTIPSYGSPNFAGSDMVVDDMYSIFSVKQRYASTAYWGHVTVPAYPESFTYLSLHSLVGLEPRRFDPKFGQKCYGRVLLEDYEQFAQFNIEGAILESVTHVTSDKVVANPNEVPENAVLRKTRTVFSKVQRIHRDFIESLSVPDADDEQIAVPYENCDTQSSLDNIWWNHERTIGLKVKLLLGGEFDPVGRPIPGLYITDKTRDFVFEITDVIIRTSYLVGQLESGETVATLAAKRR